MQNLMQSENINELLSALSKAQGKINGAKKDKSNPYFKSSYADLHSVWGACRQVLSDNGLSVVQTMLMVEGALNLVTILGHSSGQWIKSFLPVNTQKSDPQSLGSAITYMRRYSLAAIVGVAPEEDDDDGESAMEREKKFLSSEQVKKLESLWNGDKELREEILKIANAANPYQIEAHRFNAMVSYIEKKKGVKNAVAT